MAGLELTEFGEGSMKEHEEYFLSRMAEKLPLWGKVVQASDRHMVTFLNMIRASTFDMFLEQYPNATPEELKAWADWINVSTGRGPLGNFSTAGRTLAMGFFSPRFSLSRIVLPYQAFKNWKNPRIRKEIAKDQIKLAMFGLVALGLASMAGASVDMDPESPDFLKIKVGNTRFDIFGGILQPIRLTIMMVLTGKNAIQGTAEYRKDNPLDLVYRFNQYKLAPTVTLPLELIRGKTMVGEKRSPLQSVGSAFVPLMAESAMDAYLMDGAPMGIASATGEWFGLGVSTYNKDKKK